MNPPSWPAPSRPYPGSSARRATRLAGEWTAPGVLDPWLDETRLAQVQALNDPPVYRTSGAAFLSRHPGQLTSLVFWERTGLGFTGVEGRYDLILRPGELRGHELS